MPIFSTKSPEQKTFEARIERFLQSNGATGAHFWNRDDSLEALFNLVRHTQKDLSDARSRIRKNQDAHEVAINKLEAQVRDEMERYKQLQASHKKTIQEIDEENGSVIAAMERTHTTETLKLKSEHDAATKALKSRYEASEAAMKSEHDEERNRLISQLLVNVEESHEWPDDKIKLRFDELHRLIDSTASPQRHELMFPSDGEISKELDPTGFFQRGNVRARGHFLIKSVLWEIIREQFFALPFGLGAFGPGDTMHKSILKSLNDWKALAVGEPARAADLDLSIFETDSFSNRWRCLTFQRIQSNRDAVHLSFGSTLPQRMIENIAESNARIIGYLSRVVALSNSTVSREVEMEVKRATELAQEIALQFGLHSCKFIWVKPDPAWNWDPAPGLVKCVPNSKGEPSQRTIVTCTGIMVISYIIALDKFAHNAGAPETVTGLPL